MDSGDYLIISIGELTNRKNHKVVLDALKKINNSQIKYIICGRGPLRETLLDYIHHSGLDGQVFYLATEEIYANCVKDQIYLSFLPDKKVFLSH